MSSSLLGKSLGGLLVPSGAAATLVDSVTDQGGGTVTWNLIGASSISGTTELDFAGLVANGFEPIAFVSKTASTVTLSYGSATVDDSWEVNANTILITPAVTVPQYGNIQ